MKVLKFALVAALLLAAKQASALIDISGFGGYTTLNMSGPNSALEEAGGTNTKKFSSGFYAGADAGISVLPFLKVGPRLEYVQAGQASEDFGPSDTATIDANLMMYEVGVTFDSSLPLTGLSVIGGVWGGYGMANAKITEGGEQTGTGGGFVGEVAGQVRYKLVAGLSLGLDLGYRLANIATVNDANGNAFLQDSSGAVGFDFSGFNVGGALSFDF